MRIRITFLPRGQKRAVLPLNNYPFQSLIYSLLKRTSPEYSQALHDEGYSSEGSSKQFRLFVFSRYYLPDPEVRERAFIKDGHLCFDPGPVECQVASPASEFIEAILMGLASVDSVSLGDSFAAIELDVIGVDIVEPPRFKQRMYFRTLSPITVSTTDRTSDGRLGKHYVRADDDRFGLMVKANLINKYRALTAQEPSDARLQFEFDQEYIRKRGGIDRISKLVEFKETKIKSYQAPFIVNGSVELIQLGWECGFGNANSQGFGMVY